MNLIKPNNQRAKLAIIFIWVVFLAELVSLVADYFQLTLLNSILIGEMVSSEIANRNDLFQRVIGIVYLSVFICSAIFFIRWFRRAYFNLHQNVSYLQYTEGWAAGAWFVPILSLFRPFQIMKEMYVETNSIIASFNSSNLKTNKIFPFVSIWWTLWIINSILGQVIFRYKADEVSEFIFLTKLSIINSIFGLVLAIITVKVIIDYSLMENDYFHLATAEHERKKNEKIQPMDNSREYISEE